MALVSLSHVQKGYDGRTLFDDVTVEIEKGRKIGIIGQNGTGKTTLLKLIAGVLEADGGDIFRQRDLRIARQTQELEVRDGATVMEEMRRVYGEQIAVEERLRRLERELESERDEELQQRLLTKYAALQEQHESSGGYDVERRLESVLTGLGLPESSWHRPISEFSGGERNLLGLARALLAEPDVLLLDEPSNHLDLDGIEWFTRFVKSTRATVVMVSHDRHLLDVAIDEIWELRRGRISVWTGNYSDYERQRAEKFALEERQFKNQQRTIRRLEFQARRLRDMARAYDDPGQAKRAKAMQKRIEMMDKVDRPQENDRIFKAQLQSKGRHGQIALRVEDFEFSYGERVLFEPSSLEIDWGQRVALVGPNGCGKSTLFRKILEEAAWENPALRLGKSTVVGDYSQFHEDTLDSRQTLITWIQEATGLLNQPAADLLHRFLFTRDDLDREISSLSGGEKSRLQLARLVSGNVNFLMLDEPTNHLDIPSCEQLETMLEEFVGTLFVISHDRYLLGKLVDTVVEVRDKRLVVHRMSFEEWFAQRSSSSALAGGALKLESQSKAQKEQKDLEEVRRDNQSGREERKARQRESRKLQRRMEEHEARIEELEESISMLESAIEANWSGSQDAAEGRKLEARLRLDREALENTMADWEEDGARLETLE